MAWDLKGRYPEILSSPRVGKLARELYDDALRVIRRIIDEKLISAHAVFGIFPANTVGGDDIEVYDPDGSGKLLTTLHTLRQQLRKRPGQSNMALADFVAPKDLGIPDYIGAFTVTAGVGVDELVAVYESELDDYSAIMVKALADRLAEAFAEELHRLVRMNYWGYSDQELLTNRDLIKEKYIGIRPAAGYPACPDHTEKGIIFDLLNVEQNIGVELTENFAMTPAASVSGLYFAHPRATYFGLGKIAKDQIKDYAKRKAMTVEEVERWLAPNLNYD